MKRLLLLIPLLVAGCGTRVSEEGEARCLEEAGHEQNNFVAEKVYKRCSKNIMNVIREERRFAREQEEKRRVMEARLKALELERNAKIEDQLKEYDKYSDWRFWAARLTFPEETIKPSCYLHEAASVLYQTHDWRDRRGNLDPSMNNQDCWAPGSVVFYEKGFKYIQVSAYYNDMGANPGGPRAGQPYETRLNFPEYKIFAQFVDCKSEKGEIQHIARFSRLKSNDPQYFELGQGDRAEKIYSVNDPVTQKKITLASPLWVVKTNPLKFRYKVGQIRHKPTYEKVVRPTCDAHKKFWSNENLSV